MTTLLLPVVAVAMLATACSTEGSTTPTAATFTTKGSVGQVHVSDAAPGTHLKLESSANRVVATGVADSQGSLIFREVKPAAGYKVETTSSPVASSQAVTVESVESSLPPQSFYADQHLAPGFGYITTRDGTTLSTSVYLPGPVDKGPYPTVIEYSGYDPSRPGTNLLQENADALKSVVGDDPSKLCGVISFACDAPAQPSSLLARAMGYAVVAVNIRGTGCSGGAYDFFEPLQLTDGYDVVETAAAQPWVKGHKVGMVGLSYPGISQLFVAQMQPPSLAAIAPESVIEDAVRSTLAPGGILNSGFALSWAKEVGDKAKPYGQGWEKARVDAGDTTCAANQKMRGQNVDTVKVAMSHRYYPPEIADRLNPSLFVQKIKVPVFLSGSYQDEQTGGRFPLLFDKFTNAPVVHFTAMNGTHADGYAPFNLTEWKTFLDLYVADQITPIPGVVKAFAPLIMKKVFDTEVELPPQRFLDAPSVEAARAQYQAEAPIRLLFESGAGRASDPGAPVPTVDVRTTAWPPPGTKAESLWLGADGTMSATQPSADGAGQDPASRFLVDPSLAKLTTFSGDTSDIFHALPDYHWQQEPKGSAAVFLSEPLAQDQVFVGSASADLWIRTDAKDADVGVTLSEVRPDGKETFIQAGLLRASMRKVADGSTDLLPLHTGYRSDASPLQPDKWTEMRIEIFPFGQIVRAGSRIRLSVHTPGGDRPRWSYIIDQQPKGTWIDVGHSAEHPSKVVLPLSPDVLAGVQYPKELPPCPGLRGQPCRTFEAYTNTPTPNG
ncbi:MAG: CocE/NonD family hydrolase [Actinobacteria bacterium]|nr:CocE/NonD family hydrolase [Actinomycetota bacterium]